MHHWPNCSTTSVNLAVQQHTIKLSSQKQNTCYNVCDYDSLWNVRRCAFSKLAIAVTVSHNDSFGNEQRPPLWQTVCSSVRWFVLTPARNVRMVDFFRCGPNQTVMVWTSAHVVTSFVSLSEKNMQLSCKEQSELAALADSPMDRKSPEEKGHTLRQQSGTLLSLHLWKYVRGLAELGFLQDELAG